MWMTSDGVDYDDAQERLIDMKNQLKKFEDLYKTP